MKQDIMMEKEKSKGHYLEEQHKLKQLNVVQVQIQV